MHPTMQNKRNKTRTTANMAAFAVVAI